MAKTSFAATTAAPTTEATSPVEVVSEPTTSPTTHEVAVREDRALAASGGNTGEVDYSDLEIAKVNIVQKSGNLSDNYTPGSILLAKDVVLTQGKTSDPFKFVALSLKKQFQQALEYDPSGNGPRPITCATMEEVRQHGGSINYGDENYFARIATVLCLVEAPAGVKEEDLETHFLYECEDKHYALALWFMAKSAYTAGAKKLITARELGHLKAGYQHGIWTATTEMKTNAGNSWFVPQLKPAGKTTETFQKFAAEVLG